MSNIEFPKGETNPHDSFIRNCLAKPDLAKREKLVIRNSRSSPSTLLRASFTLIELLVVLAVVAILSVVVILTLNPAELIKQARDSNRLSDLGALNTALGLFNGDVNAGFMGTSSIVYVSIADTTSTCANLGLPSLPTGYSYNCVTSTSTKNIDGTGWVPVNFKLISFGNPISSLPVDPVNTTSTRNYYTYTPGGSWDLTATLEASKNKLGGANDKVSTDGGTYPDLYETGTKLTLLPVDYGDASLVGYWNFEEGSGGIVKDLSGSGNTGTWYGTSTSRYVAGKVGSYAGYFNGGSDYVVLGDSVSHPNVFTKTLWFNRNSLSQCGSETRCSFIAPLFETTYYNRLLVFYSYQLTPSGWFVSSNTLASDVWNFGAVVYDGASVKFYLNGVLSGSTTASKTSSFQNSTIIGASAAGSGSRNFGGLMDDVHIYSRALSAAEISALYNATK